MIPPTLPGLNFTQEEISAAGKSNGLLSMDLELTRSCNLACVYCYAEAGKAQENELSFEEISEVLAQAVRLGLRTVTIIGGGEPLLYPRLRELIEYILTLRIVPVLFTNAILLNDNWISYLNSKHVPVVTKLNSFKEEIQDSLNGQAGSAKKMYERLEQLIAKGYPKGAGMGIETVITHDTLPEIPDIWRYCRNNSVIPYVETLTLQGRAKAKYSKVTAPELKELFELLKKIDQTEYGYTWEAHPPIAGHTCRRHLYSATLTCSGDIQPCPGVPISIGSIRQASLAHIISSSQVIKNLRSIYLTVKDACRSCDLNGTCYGCRGNAYHMTGDYLSGDPTCWKCGQL